MDELDLVQRARAFIEEHLDTAFESRGRRLTHREISAECGVSQSVISLYIRGFIVEGKFKQLCLFLCWLGVSPTDFASAVGLWRKRE